MKGYYSISFVLLYKKCAVWELDEGVTESPTELNTTLTKLIGAIV